MAGLHGTRVRGDGSGGDANENDEQSEDADGEFHDW
jgi:hypothetical protein